MDKPKSLRTEVLQKLFYNSKLSINTLSKLTRKSLPLVTKVVNELIQEEYVCELGYAPSTGGRRASLFILNPDKKLYIISIAMDQLITRMVIYNLAYQPISPVQSTELKIESAEALDQLLAFISKNLNASGIPKDLILGIGIGMPGFISVEHGENYSHLLPANGMALRTYLSTELELPVFIDNDSSLIASAELHFGAAKGKRDVMVVNVSWGTGLGMIVNGNLYRGSSGFAGEFSHIPLSDSNNLCLCGKRGCLEVETSLLVMTKRAQKEISEGAESSMTTRFKDESKDIGVHFLAAASEHDPLAVTILSDAAFLLGKGLSTLIHIMNPESIILSGRGAAAGKILLPPVQQAINEFCIPRLAERTQIVISKLANDAELMAAAALVIENVQLKTI